MTFVHEVANVLNVHQICH